MRNERFVRTVAWVAIAALGATVLVSVVGLFS